MFSLGEAPTPSCPCCCWAAELLASWALRVELRRRRRLLLGVEICGNLLLGVEPYRLGVLASGLVVSLTAGFVNSCVCGELAFVAVVEDVLFKPPATNVR